MSLTAQSYFPTNSIYTLSFYSSSGVTNSQINFTVTGVYQIVISVLISDLTTANQGVTLLGGLIGTGNITLCSQSAGQYISGATYYSLSCIVNGSPTLTGYIQYIGITGTNANTNQTTGNISVVRLA